MKHLSTLSAALAIFLLTSGFQIRPPVPLKSTTRLTLNTNDNARTTFETIARSAGLQVLFTSNFRSDSPVTFSVENRSVPGALDLLSKQTGTFWTIWDSDTILVATDNEANRRSYDRQFVATIALPRQQDPQAVLTGLKGAAAVGSTIVVRDTLAGIERAGEVIAGVTGSSIEPRILGASTEVFLAPGGTGLRSTAQKRSVLRIPTPASVSLEVTNSVRSIYENLATAAGLNIIFGRNFPARTSSFQSENADFFDALDSLAAGTGTLWQPIDANTIQVLEDTPQNRRDFELHQLEVVYLPEGTTVQRLNESMTAARLVLGLRGIYQSEPRKAVVLHDTPANLLVVEDLIATLEGTPSLMKAVITDSSTAFPEAGGPFHSLPSTKAFLKLKSTGVPPLNLNQSADLRTVYENIASAGGLGVVFGPRFPARTEAFRFDRLDVVDALDMLALQSQTFWQPLDDHTILVLENTQQNRRDYETRVLKTILLPVRTTTLELNTVLNILRTALSLRGVYQSAIANAIVVHDRPDRVEVVERVIRQLIPNPNAIISLTVPAPGFAESRFITSAPAARSQLAFTNAGSISLQLNRDSRGFYEALAGMGSIKVNFDPRFTSGSVASSRIAGVDVPDALDRLSLETGNYWAVVDSNTILVAPDTPQVRQQFEPQVSRTVGLKTLTPGLAGEIVNILRTALSMRQVDTNGAYSITIKDNHQRVAIAEQIIANLDRP
jgi:hypothetical protein